MTITPDQARELLDGAIPGPWRALHDQWEDEDGTPCEDFYVLGGPDGILHTEDFDPDTHSPVANTTLAAAAPDLAQTIAGMHEEWAKEFRVNGGIWIPEMWHRNRADAERDQYMRWRDHTTTIESRLVRRLVSETEVVEP